jgi:DNA-binding response OmpR family regulator
VATILVIDDEPDVIEVVSVALEKAGHTVLTAPDGQTGLMLTLTRQPDLVVLDVMMPGIDGFEVLRRMKTEPRMANIPVLMLTARTDYSSKARAWEEYAQNYLTKPFDVDELAEAVNSMLEERSRLQQAAVE